MQGLEQNRQEAVLKPEPLKIWKTGTEPVPLFFVNKEPELIQNL